MCVLMSNSEIVSLTVVFQIMKRYSYGYFLQAKKVKQHNKLLLIFYLTWFKSSEQNEWKHSPQTVL